MTTTTTTANENTVSAQAWEHFRLLNALRALGFICPNGAVFAPNPIPLKFDCRLWKAAHLHSMDMCDQHYFSDTSLDGRSPWDRAEEQGTSANVENLAAGVGTAQGVLDTFKRSDTHCRFMLNPNLRVGGVGYAQGGFYGHYWTQMLASWTGEVDTWCYPTGATLLEARTDADQIRDSHSVLGEGWSSL